MRPVEFGEAVDPKARFTYVVDEFDFTVSGYSVDPKTGALAPLPGSSFATGNLPTSIAITGQ